MSLALLPSSEVGPATAHLPPIAPWRTATKRPATKHPSPTRHRYYRAWLPADGGKGCQYRYHCARLLAGSVIGCRDWCHSAQLRVGGGKDLAWILRSLLIPPPLALEIPPARPVRSPVPNRVLHPAVERATHTVRFQAYLPKSLAVARTR